MLADRCRPLGWAVAVVGVVVSGVAHLRTHCREGERLLRVRQCGPAHGGKSSYLTEGREGFAAWMRCSGSVGQAASRTSPRQVGSSLLQPYCALCDCCPAGQRLLKVTGD